MASGDFDVVLATFNSAPKDKVLAWPKLKAFVGDQFKAVEMGEFVHDGIENNVGKGENADYQHFLLFPHCFQKDFSSVSVKFGIV